LEQFLHAFTSRGFDSVSWAFLLRIPIKCNIIIVLFISYRYVLFSGTAIPAIFFVHISCKSICLLNYCYLRVFFKLPLWPTV